MADGRWQKTPAGNVTAPYGYMETRLNEVKMHMKGLGIRHSPSTPMWPQGNAEVSFLTSHWREQSEQPT